MRGYSMDNEILNDIYDILAQNKVDKGARESILAMIDHVDNDTDEIVFNGNSGKQFVLRMEMR